MSDDTVSVREVDLVVIGSGSGNSIADERFADRSVAIIERNPVFGGTCLNVGCIPTKMFVQAANVARSATDAARFGVDAQFTGARWSDIVGRIFGRIDSISRSGEQWRRSGAPNVSLISGTARFTAPLTLRIDDGPDAGTIVRAGQIVLATGSRAIVPDVIADSGVAFHTSDTIMRLPQLPRHLVIVGSGTIAAEFANIFSGLGSRVTIIARGDHLLRTMDQDISDTFTRLAAKQWDVRLGHEVAGLTGPAPDGPGEGADDAIAVTLTDGSTVTCDTVLVAVGRYPNGDRLGAEHGGVELKESGEVVVDRYGRTTARNVWALGDVASDDQLKHVANAQARAVADNLLKDWDDTADLAAFPDVPIPRAVFTQPEIAAVGLTERQARDAGYDITVKVQPLGAVAYGWALEDSDGFCKVIAERGTGRLLGAHVLGLAASTVIQPLIQAMSFGQTAIEVARGQYWIHPALSELVENALLGLDI